VSGEDSISSLDAETRRLLISFQRQAERIRALVSNAQDVADANDLLAFQVLQRLRSLEERVRALEAEVGELRAKAGEKG